MEHGRSRVRQRIHEIRIESKWTCARHETNHTVHTRGMKKYVTSCVHGEQVVGYMPTQGIYDLLVITFPPIVCHFLHEVETGLGKPETEGK